MLIFTLFFGDSAYAAYSPEAPVTIVARDFAFDAPDTIPAGMTTIHFVNRGPDLHHAMLVRLDGNHTAADFAKAMEADGPPSCRALMENRMR